MSTKINAVVDQQGMPVRIVLSQGQSSDKTIAPTLIEGLKPDRDLVADRGYDARAIIDLVEARGGRAHIPTSRDRKVQRSVDFKVNANFSYLGTGASRSLVITTPSGIPDNFDAAPILVKVTDPNGDSTVTWFTLTVSAVSIFRQRIR